MRKTLRERIHAKTNYGTGEGCWLWVGSLNEWGYGTAWDGDRVRTVHRIVYELADCPIPDGMCVMHICDTPACIRPTHLRLGTNADNVADKVSKGRQSSGKRHGDTVRGDRHGRCDGEFNGRAVFTVDQVREIRRNGPGQNQSELSRRYGVSRYAIAQILNGKTWKHVTEAA